MLRCLLRSRRSLLLFNYERVNCLFFESASRFQQQQHRPLTACFQNDKNKYKNEYNCNDLNLKSSVWPFLVCGAALLAKELDDSTSFADTNIGQITSKSRKKIFNFIADVVDETLPSIVQIEIRKKALFGIQTVGSGSGFIVSEDGLILTNAHVVQDKNADLIVKLNDGRTLPGRVIKMDVLQDLAVIKVESRNVCNKKNEQFIS